MPANRGSVSIYKDLFDFQPPVSIADSKTPFREKRNECITDYYYFIGRKEFMINGKPARLSYSSILEIVSNTFFLSTFTVHDIIQSNNAYISLVKQQWKEQPVDKMQKHFSVKWPQFVW